MPPYQKIQKENVKGKSLIKMKK